MAKRGRKRIEFDYVQLARLCALFLSDEELAEWFGCSVDTITRRKQDDEKFAEAYNRGRSRGKIGLRRAQFQTALGGNPTMQIWLGKQILGQKDQREHKVDATGPLVIMEDGGDGGTAAG